jgi:hypothetical protein
MGFDRLLDVSRQQPTVAISLVGSRSSSTNSAGVVDQDKQLCVLSLSMLASPHHLTYVGDPRDRFISSLGYKRSFQIVFVI